MSTPGAGAVTDCPRCHREVPAANYCGLCGASLAAASGIGRWLRARTFGASPNQGVLRPALASTLFPHLPQRSRRAFRIGLAVLVVGLGVFAALRIPAVLVGIGALGLPLLFLLYLRASGVGRDLPDGSLPLAGALGVALGVGWARVAGELGGSELAVAMSAPGVGHGELRGSVLAAISGGLLMMLPAVAVRLTRPRTAESLDGFVIGAFGALAFSAAATVTRLAPQFRTGFIPPSRPRSNLAVEAVVCGITVPLTAAVAGGVVGLALWFASRGDGSGRARPTLWLLGAAVLATYIGVGVVNAAGLVNVAMVGLHLLLAITAIVLLRLALQTALLHEAPDPVTFEPLLCVHCEHVVPDAAFCPACGVATRASSKQSRRLRRQLRPVPVEPGPSTAESGDERFYDGIALGAQRYRAPAIRRPRLSRVMGRWTAGITAAAVVLLGVTVAITKPASKYLCPPQCGKPPNGTAVQVLPRFVPKDNSFSVAYPAPGSAYDVTVSDNGVTARFTAGDGGVMQMFSQPAGGRTARQVVKAVLGRAYPNAVVAYEIPGATVGYQPGYGEAADDWPQSSTSTYTRTRILVLAAVKNDLALIAFATGPERAFRPGFGPGPPSGANLELAIDMGKYVNSFRWRGDPDR